MDLPPVVIQLTNHAIVHMPTMVNIKKAQYPVSGSSIGFLGHNAILSAQGGFIRSCRIACLKANGTTKLNQTIHLRVKFSVTAKGKFLWLPPTDTVLA